MSFGRLIELKYMNAKEVYKAQIYEKCYMIFYLSQRVLHDFLFRVIVTKYMNAKEVYRAQIYEYARRYMSLDFLFRSKSIICKSVI